MARIRGTTITYAVLAGALQMCFAACGSDSGTNNIGQTVSPDGSTGTGANANAGGAVNAGGATGTGNGTAVGLGGQSVLGVDANLITGNTQCSNGKDDDGDGLIDGFDPECTGPLDNDESTFATGIPGDNVDPKWQDCFFDGNSGAGDDGCRYATGCLTGDVPQTSKDCTLTQQCINFCRGFVPNGCDCFGCCTIFTDTGQVDIAIGTGCSVDKVNDQTACPRCTKSTQCANDCGTCELCLGKTVADLPASCAPKPPTDGGTPVVPDGGDAAPPPPTYTCNNGETTCSLTQPCPTGGYCSQGCCLTIH